MISRSSLILCTGGDAGGLIKTWLAWKFAKRDCSAASIEARIAPCNRSSSVSSSTIGDNNGLRGDNNGLRGDNDGLRGEVAGLKGAQLPVSFMSCNEAAIASLIWVSSSSVMRPGDLGGIGGIETPLDPVDRGRGTKEELVTALFGGEIGVREALEPGGKIGVREALATGGKIGVLGVWEPGTRTVTLAVVG